MDLNNWGQPNHKISWKHEKSGSEHDGTWTAIVYVDDKECGRGKGKTKREAEEAAAKQALEVVQPPQQQ
ncbi:hypothetical protein K435DRAFT_864140 [Dendrothele bispora CBS 962.96]|uniref:DRBM domain-containing protein n=1 Tax=Dendrothele bispora (strain CBS 962.96) TaxID=1314807 RepID=A0A4S8LPA7_DENBC|nr:hypothetical protein K435DRAFT_864140 [Dendrothele bispora CBS 962.96]